MGLSRNGNAYFIIQCVNNNVVKWNKTIKLLSWQVLFVAHVCTSFYICLTVVGNYFHFVTVSHKIQIPIQCAKWRIYLLKDFSFSTWWNYLLLQTHALFLTSVPLQHLQSVFSAFPSFRVVKTEDFCISQSVYLPVKRNVSVCNL